MGNKKTNEFLLNWQSSSPVPYNPNTALSGTTAGAMASTNTIYSNILDLRNFDNVGLELTWTGTPTGSISIMCSVSGQTFYALTFNPSLSQPAGSAGGYLIDLQELPFRYLYVQYTNSTGSGSLTAYVGAKDLN